MRFRTAISALLVFGILFAVTTARGSLEELYGLVCSGWTVILLAGIVPLIALIISGKSGRRKGTAQKTPKGEVLQ